MARCFSLLLVPVGPNSRAIVSIQSGPVSLQAPNPHRVLAPKSLAACPRRRSTVVAFGRKRQPPPIAPQKPLIEIRCAPSAGSSAPLRHTPPLVPAAVFPPPPLGATLEVAAVVVWRSSMSSFARNPSLAAGGFWPILASLRGAEGPQPPGFSLVRGVLVHPPGGDFPRLPAPRPIPRASPPTPRPTLCRNNTGHSDLRSATCPIPPEQWPVHHGSKTPSAGGRSRSPRARAAFHGLSGLHLSASAVYFIQTPKNVWMFYEVDTCPARLLYPSLRNPKPSVRRIGPIRLRQRRLDTSHERKTWSNSTSAHTEEAAVVTWRLSTPQGAGVNITVDDPDTFKQARFDVQRYQRGEHICRRGAPITISTFLPIRRPKTPDF